LAVAYEGLGEANEAAGLLDAAEEAFIRSVRASEQMGMLPDMLNLMMKTARVRALMGRDTDVVELLAAVCANPISEQQPFTERVPIRENAVLILDQVRSGIDSGVYDDAFEAGESASFDSVLNELLGRGADSASVLA
jgi:hypothetical protein